MGSKFLTMVGGGAGGGIKLESIAITTPPDNITYLPGEVFDGIVLQRGHIDSHRLDLLSQRSTARGDE